MRFSSLCSLVLSFVLIAPLVSMAAEPSCPVQLDESVTHAALVAQSRDQIEQRLAQAIRANRELSAMADKLIEQNKKLTDEVSALKPKKDEPKP